MHEQRSFSFSSFDLNSSNNSRLFSSDDDEDAYIEINLNPQPRKTSIRVDDGGVIKRIFCIDEKESNSSEVELRISFSSAGIPPSETTSCGTTQHAQGATTTKPRLGIFVSLARIVNEFMAASSGKTSNSVRAIEANNVAQQYGRAHLPAVSKADCMEILRTGKDCTIVANSKRKGIMNFIVKLKYKNIPSMFVTMVTPKPKTRQIRSRQPLLQRGSSTRRNPMNNDNMKLKNRNYSDFDYQDQNRDKSSTSSSVGGIINFKAVKGVLDALIVRMGRYYTSAKTGTLSANKQNTSKSCPSSIKSSPMHNNVCDDEVRKFYSRDNSVQAAIAHCKKSFGTQAEFDFHL